MSHHPVNKPGVCTKCSKNSAAKTCKYRFCGACCIGPCARHGILRPDNDRLTGHKRRSGQHSNMPPAARPRLDPGTYGACSRCRGRMVEANGEYGSYWWCRECDSTRALSAHLKDIAAAQPVLCVAQRGDLGKLTMMQLREHCVHHKLPVSGLKPELIARLMRKLCPEAASTAVAVASAQAATDPVAKLKRRITKAMGKFRLVAPIRAELVRRGLSSQGLKSELQARLEQAFRVEFSSVNQKASTHVNIEGDSDEDEDDTGKQQNESGSSGPESFSGKTDSPETRSIRDPPCSSLELQEDDVRHDACESPPLTVDAAHKLETKARMEALRTVAHLRRELEKQGQSTSGTKAVLQIRLSEYLQSALLRGDIQPRKIFGGKLQEREHDTSHPKAAKDLINKEGTARNALMENIRDQLISRRPPSIYPQGLTPEDVYGHGVHFIYELFKQHPGCGPVAERKPRDDVAALTPALLSRESPTPQALLQFGLRPQQLSRQTGERGRAGAAAAGSFTADSAVAEISWWTG
ncbi:hypothetical protein CYMTET_5472 [Cymbomonas tetramitiformis]|uniref:SAP domain-containing protein n=1 Tax=Cymbomonas tetramitiformis TaxID=36881 RepID=A0AAE0LJC3_9CHLO|nr:hypothetical protein CYMTET_5472 [Cymbomonas tetramitiformis]